MVATKTGTQAIDRAARLLALVLDSPAPLTVTELAGAAGLAGSTTSRLLAALEHHGFVERLGDRGPLAPGPRLVRFAQRLAGPDLALLAAPDLDRLADLTGETVNLSILGSAGVEHIAQRDAAHFLGSTNWIGRTAPMHVSASGKVFLAFGGAALPDGPLEQLTPASIVDRAEFRRHLDLVRQRGYATIVDELEPGLTAVAAPVRGARGEVVAGISISAPTIRLSAERVTRLGALLVEEAGRLAARLGHRTTNQGAA